MSLRKMLPIALLVLVAVILAACAGPQGEPGPAGPAGPAGPPGPPGEPPKAADLSCTSCHNDTTRIAAKAFAWEESLHGSGTSTAYAGNRGPCAACHSGGDFSAMVAAGQTPAEYSGGGNATRQDCRACHQIHTSYTDADWALETTDPVTLFAFENVTFDGGEGNLCANCHQPRRAFVATDGIVDWTSTHYGPHHGPQSAMLLGLGGSTEGTPSAHATMVEDTCVSCHMGENDNHTFEPDVAACQACHSGAEDFDINGTRTEVEAKLAELKEALIAKSMLTEEDESVVGQYPEAEGAALWNYIFIAHEDKSLGVHNPAYTLELLESSLAALGE